MGRTSPTISSLLPSRQDGFMDIKMKIVGLGPAYQVRIVILLSRTKAVASAG